MQNLQTSQAYIFRILQLFATINILLFLQIQFKRGMVNCNNLQICANGIYSKEVLKGRVEEKWLFLMVFSFSSTKKQRNANDCTRQFKPFEYWPSIT